MPRQIELPAKPELKFGVFNRYGREASPHDGEYAAAGTRVGWKVAPFYGYGGGNIVQPEREAAERLLPGATEAWQQRVLSHKRAIITMQEVLVDRFIQRIDVIRGWGPAFYFMDDTHVMLERTRGYSTPTLDGPTQGPFIIKRILADHRTFRLEDGRSLIFSNKLKMRESSIPQWILDQVFGP